LAAWKLTVREGSDVRRLKFDDLDEALAEVKSRIEAIAAGEPLGKINAIRDYEPEVLIKARLEVTGKGLVRPPTAGVDVRGDNSLVVFSGGVSRKELSGNTAAQAVVSMREALTG
jgi:hypothetical protein